MAFATLEEAWGMPVLDRPAAPRAASPANDDISTERRPRLRQARVTPAAPDEERAGPRFRPPFDDARSHAAVEVHTAQRVLARAYVDHGIAGVLALLPPDAAAALGSRYAHHRRRRGVDLWNMLNTPETLLFVLLCAFAMLVLWDSWRPAEAAMVPSMASLHMSPFPLSS